MDKLEKFISENASHFSDAEPAPDHLRRFSKKLDKESGKTNFSIGNNMMLKVAAVILILITATVFVFDFATRRISNAVEMKSDAGGLSNEIRDAMNYYDGQTKTRMGEFNKLACCGEEKSRLNSMAVDELNTLDENITGLKLALQTDPDNEKIQAALIRNQQMKGEVLDNMITQMKRAKGGD